MSGDFSTCNCQTFARAIVLRTIDVFMRKRREACFAYTFYTTVAVYEWATVNRRQKFNMNYCLDWKRRIMASRGLLCGQINASPVRFSLSLALFASPLYMYGDRNWDSVRPLYEPRLWRSNFLNFISNLNFINIITNEIKFIKSRSK